MFYCCGCIFQGVGTNDEKVLVLAATNTPYALDQVCGFMWSLLYRISLSLYFCNRLVYRLLGEDLTNVYTFHCPKERHDNTCSRWRGLFVKFFFHEQLFTLMLSSWLWCDVHNQVHLGDTPHDLTESDFETLGYKTEGFSGSDISVCVSMEPNKAILFLSLALLTFFFFKFLILFL